MSTIEEVKADKKLLENEILGLLAEFRKKHGVYIEGIDYSEVMCRNMGLQAYWVPVECNIKVSI